MQAIDEARAEELWNRALSLDRAGQNEAQRLLQFEQPSLHDWLQDRAQTRFEPEIGELFEQTALLMWYAILDDASQQEERLRRVEQVDLSRMETACAPVMEWLSDERMLELAFEERFEQIVFTSAEGVRTRELLRLAFDHMDDAHQDRNPELDDFNFALLMFLFRVLGGVL